MNLGTVWKLTSRAPHFFTLDFALILSRVIFIFLIFSGSLGRAEQSLGIYGWNPASRWHEGEEGVGALQSGTLFGIHYAGAEFLWRLEHQGFLEATGNAQFRIQTEDEDWQIWWEKGFGACGFWAIGGGLANQKISTQTGLETVVDHFPSVAIGGVGLGVREDFPLRFLSEEVGLNLALELRLQWCEVLRPRLSPSGLMRIGLWRSW